MPLFLLLPLPQSLRDVMSDLVYSEVTYLFFCDSRLAWSGAHIPRVPRSPLSSKHNIGSYLALFNYLHHPPYSYSVSLQHKCLQVSHSMAQRCGVHNVRFHEIHSMFKHDWSRTTGYLYKHIRHIVQINSEHYADHQKTMLHYLAIRCKLDTTITGKSSSIWVKEIHDRIVVK